MNITTNDMAELSVSKPVNSTARRMCNIQCPILTTYRKEMWQPSSETAHGMWRNVLFTDRLNSWNWLHAEVIISANGIRPETAKTVIVISAEVWKPTMISTSWVIWKLPIHSTNMIKVIIWPHTNTMSAITAMCNIAYAHSTITPSTIKTFWP